MHYLLVLDQGTTSSRAIIFDERQRVVAVRQKETKQMYPHPGWVEQDPQDIWAATVGVMQEVIAASGLRAQDICALGITNQRETTIVWEKETGKPLYNAIVWQCRRTAEDCEQIRAQGMAETIQKKTGLLLDAYFSATKLRWILDRVDPDRSRSSKGDILFGTVDTWLLWKLSEGRIHATDRTNASRTMLYNIHTLDWDDELLRLFHIPRAMLGEVRPSSHIFGNVAITPSVSIPVAGIAGDQQAALFGQGCFAPGEAKNTYGTGCFLLMNIGQTPKQSQHGLITTLAASGDGAPVYALEGSIFVGGAVVQWLRDELRFIEDAADSAFFAEKCIDNGGVYLVPAFVGLGAPHWDMYARGAIYGLTRGSGRAHIIRAALEAICYQTVDVLDCMRADADLNLEALKADGGAAANHFLMQFQADMLNTPVVRPQNLESTAFGAAALAGLAVGVWPNEEALRHVMQEDCRFLPQMEDEVRKKNRQGWQEALRRTLTKI